jgi:asparagine synthase (glutamine-hydrolysing)
MALQEKGHPVKTSSIGFDDRRFNELEYAGIVAAQYNTDHSRYVVSPDALDIVEKMVWHFDEPFADASAVPTWYVSKMARQKVTVALSGDGGDETFAGYIQRYSMNRFEENIRRRLPAFLRTRLLGPLASLYPRLDFMPRPLRLKTFLTNLSLTQEQAYFRDMSFYFKPEAKKSLYNPDFAARIDPGVAQGFLNSHFTKNHNPDPTTRVQYVDIKSYLPEDILVKVDRMSMAHSLEVRAPLLDHKVIEYGAGLPSNLKLHGKVSKYILKKMNEDRLPRDILYRAKQGFNVPLDSWLRGDMKELAHDALFASRSGLHDYFNMKYVKGIWDRHQDKRENNGTSLWGLMMLGLWKRVTT